MFRGRPKSRPFESSVEAQSFVAIGASFVGMKKNINGGHSLKTLSKEGQETFGKAIGQATRRLDVETQSLKAIVVYAAKDSLSVES